jgi:hypothetical protein
MVLNRAIITALSSGADRARSDRSTTNKNPGKFPSLIESSGRVTGTISVPPEGVVATRRSNETGSQPVTPDCAGVCSAVGVSPLGVGSETSCIRLLALASRCVIGFRPKQASSVAGIEAWS